MWWAPRESGTMKGQMERDRRGEQLGAHIVGEPIAEGAMGRVYRARHPETDDEVAVKVLHGKVAEDEVAVERFRREYETAKSLNDAHIVEVLDFGETGDGTYFMTMEYLDGDNLGLVLSREGALELSRVVRILCQLALGLHQAHTDGVVHRDLKPDNILVCAGADGDEIHILDFGSVKLQIASGKKLTTTGTTVGSPYYMSPEQAMGKTDVDQRTDVFALAALLHELSTGKVAFEADTVAEILIKIVDEEPPPLTTLNSACPHSLEKVVQKGLHKDKAERFGSTVELAEAMLLALGLDADVERWSRTPQLEVAEALKTRVQSESVASPTLHENRTASMILGALVIVAVVAGAWLIFS